MVVNSSSWYQYPNSTDTQGIFEFFRFINNEVTDYLFFPVMLLVIWFITFVGVFSTSGLNRPAAARSWTFASFLCAILSILMTTMGFLSPRFMYISFIFVAIGILWVKIEGN